MADVQIRTHDVETSMDNGGKLSNLPVTIRVNGREYLQPLSQQKFWIE
jgi:hypothetical protein